MTLLATQEKRRHWQFHPPTPCVLTWSSANTPGQTPPTVFPRLRSRRRPRHLLEPPLPPKMRRANASYSAPRLSRRHIELASRPSPVDRYWDRLLRPHRQTTTRQCWLIPCRGDPSFLETGASVRRYPPQINAGKIPG